MAASHEYLDLDLRPPVMYLSIPKKIEPKHVTNAFLRGLKVEFSKISTIGHLVATLCTTYSCWLWTHMAHMCPDVQPFVCISNSN